MGDVIRLDRSAQVEPPKVSPADDLLLRLARLSQAFSGMRKADYIASFATEDGGVVGITYGDLATLVNIYVEADEQLTRIATWHCREKRPGGLVGDRCEECGQPWPCDTWLVTVGQYVDESHYEPEDPEKKADEA